MARKKNHVIDVEQHIIGELRKSQNPVHPNYYPHHYRLMEAALKMKDFSNNFRADFWRPFLNSYSQWIKSLRSSFSSCAAVEQKILVQEGRGKYTIPLDLPDYLEYKRPLFFVLPEALPDKPFNG